MLLIQYWNAVDNIMELHCGTAANVNNINNQDMTPRHSFRVVPMRLLSHFGNNMITTQDYRMNALRHNAHDKHAYFRAWGNSRT